VLTLVIFALSGCLKIPASGVAVKAVTADLVFGVPPLAEPVAPPGFTIPEAETTSSRPSPSSRSTTAAPKPPSPPREFCPTASDQTFPDEEASTSVKGLPKEGLYAWKSSLIKEGPEEFKGTPKGIGGVRQTSATNSEFRVGELNIRGSGASEKEALLSFRFVVQDFQIIQDGGSDDGIFLVKITQYKDANDQRGTTFTPEPKIKVLPLPVRAGLTLGEGNAGIDNGGSLAVLKQTGIVTGRKRVDACGVVIDSWFVNGDQEYVAPNGVSYKIDYDYSVATQFGGYIAFEHTVEDRGSFKITEDRNIGRLEPFAPVPFKQLGR